MWLPKGLGDAYGLRVVPTDSPNYLQILEAVPGCYLILDPELRILAVTDAYVKATMTQREQIVGRKLFEVFPDNPDDVGAEGVANLRASIQRAIHLRRPDSMPVQKYDIRKPEAEGGGYEVRYWSPINTPVHTTTGELTYVIHAVEDVTSFVRLKAEGAEAARATEALRSEAGRMEAEILRRAREVQVVNRELMTLKEGLEQRVQARTAELQEANDNLRQAMAALENTQEQLRQSQRLEAIGRLAGGVSHDFNNLLSVILSYSEMILEEGPPALPYRSELEQVRKAALRAGDLTKQLLAFSRRQLLDLQILEPNVVVNNLALILERTLGEEIELRLQLGHTLTRIKADQGHLEQVLMNLVVNARDAMPNGGRLTIETKNVYLDEEYAKEHLGVVPGDYVMLAVSDTGLGMDKATQRQAAGRQCLALQRGRHGHLDSHLLAREPGATAAHHLTHPRSTEGSKPRGHPPGRGRRDGSEAGGRHVEQGRLHGRGGERAERSAPPGVRRKPHLRSAADGRDHARPQRAGVGGSSPEPTAQVAGALHVRLHRRRDPPPRRARLWGRLRAEAPHTRAVVSEGPRRLGRVRVSGVPRPMGPVVALAFCGPDG